MLLISDAEALNRALVSQIDDRLKRLLRCRRDQLGGDITDQAQFVIMESHDRSADIEKEIGFAIDAAKGGYDPEWVEDHGWATEHVWILTDDGYAHVLIIPKNPAIDVFLL